MVNKDYIKKELEQFRKDIKFWRGIALRIFAGFMIILLGSLGHTYVTSYTGVDNIMEEIQLPSEAVKVSTGRLKDGAAYYYKIQGMNDDGVRIYFKKELPSKGWEYTREDNIGNNIYFRDQIKLILKTNQTFPDQKKSFDFDFCIVLRKYKD